MEGFSGAKTLRKKGYETPFIFLTAKSMKEDKLNGYVLELLVNNNFYSLKDINKYLQEEFSIDLQDLGYDLTKEYLTSEEILTSKEFKLFQGFNTPYMLKTKERDIIWETGFYFGDFNTKTTEKVAVNEFNAQSRKDYFIKMIEQEYTSLLKQVEQVKRKV